MATRKAKITRQVKIVKRSVKPRLSKFREESLCQSMGYQLVAGIDEVGRGCLAGPVVAAAVIMPLEKVFDWYREIKDSKFLTEEQRERLVPLIYRQALTIGTGVVDSRLIDSHGMTYAVRLAMQIAVEQMLPCPDYLLIDYMKVPALAIPQKGVVNGDTLCFSIACASIIAKVYRDHLMTELDRVYPGYGLANNKGYGTREHVTGLRRLGPSAIHRQLFEPVKNHAQLSLDEILTLSSEMAGSET
jgi:ribonuclease HII